MSVSSILHKVTSPFHKASHTGASNNGGNMTKFEIPTEQWAQVIPSFGSPTEYKKIPVEKPESDELLIHVKYSGVCHSDVHARAGDWAVQPKMPLISGHEGVGVVVAKGDAVRGWELGDQAGIKWFNGTCLHCSFCVDGQEQGCINEPRLSGYTVPGSFQQYAIVKATHTTKIPADIDLAGVAPVMCAGLTVYKGIKETGARPGQWVAIVGAAGGLGSFGIQYAKAMGLRVIAVDAGADKEKSCLDLGAEVYVDATGSKDAIGDLRKATPDGLGPHAAVIVASEEEPFTHASDFVRPQGTVSIVGIPAHAYVRTDSVDMIMRMVTLKGSLVGNHADTDEAVDFFRRGLIKVPYRIVGLSQVNSVLDELEKNKVIGRYVVDTSK